jgi:hypothetical protein
MRRFFERHRADERIREEQQGLGRPIISVKANDHQIVAVGNVVHFSRTWKTFPDFLADYIKGVLDPVWGNAELAKPFADRHPVMQWYDTYCRYQQATIKTPGLPVQAIVTGIVACYLGLAYNLYLLAHNGELQKRLIERLKVPDQFQGAYYELIVANLLIRAGFELELEDEADGTSKHCEFSARSRRTGKKYWVEAKMRSVVGQLGKTAADGTTSTNPLGRLIPQLNDAFKKPAADERLIFIDLNAEMTANPEGKPLWIEAAARRLERYEKEDLDDWRLDVSVSVQKSIVPVLNQIYQDWGKEAVIHIAAHSFGGLLMRYYLQSGKFNGDPVYSKIKTFVTFGTPHNGAPVALAGALGLHATTFMSIDQSKCLANNLRYLMYPLIFRRCRRPQRRFDFDLEVPDSVR